MTLSKGVQRTVWNALSIEMNAIADTVRSTLLNHVLYCHCPRCAIQTYVPKVNETETLPEEKKEVGEETILQNGPNQ